MRDIKVIVRHVEGLGSINGLTVEEERAYRDYQRSQRPRPEPPEPPERRKREAALPVMGLDFWSEPAAQDDGEEEPGDVGPQPTTRLCPVCQGTRRARDDSQCEECGGTGRIDNEDEDHELEEE